MFMQLKYTKRKAASFLNTSIRRLLKNKETDQSQSQAGKYSAVKKLFAF